MKKILVSGGSGFIGTHLVNDLVKDYEVYVMDNHLPGFGNHDKNPKAYYINADIRKYADVLFATSGIDIVVHLAAISHISTCIKNPKLCMDVNVGGTINILEACKENNVSRVIVASSDHLYGKSPNYLPVDEIHPFNALYESDPYGQSKAIQAILSKLYYNRYNLPVVITASGNVFGEKQNFPNVIPNFIDAALNNNDLIIHGDGTQTREMYHVSNLIDGYIKCIETEGIEGELFNFGGEFEISINELAYKILELIPESTSKIKYVNNKSLNAMDKMFLDINKAKKILNYKVITSFEDGLKETIKKY